MQHIAIEQYGHILTLTINRPDKKNALTRDMYLSLANAINYAGHDEDARVIIIKGTDGVFTAGNDMHDFISATQQTDADVNETEQFMRALMECELPIIAQVEGLAIGIGATLLLHCDFVYCSRNTILKTPFINLGLVPEYASSYIMPRLMGHVKASEWLLLGESVTAESAKDMGMVNEVLETEALQAKVMQTAQKLADLPQAALRQSKRLMKANTIAVKDHMYAELKIFIAAMQSEEAKQAFDAFVQRS
ncbi:enoyl-CoA hydratase [Alteromonas sp. LMIT006]|uniref:enoyl-CoA hydratase n=1 Tax=Alteromonadaceae TaxID=72275 RepID=UPI0020CA8189|nr:enoyl-CoA hydratase [Alteromonas sp. LMIT006]UTP72030.1 enoyl-CoA hydratase [Alteromonas sp. LMIT006]